MRKNNIEDLIGRRFGKLVVVGKIQKEAYKNRIKWICKCDCGTERILIAHYLIAGKTKSCGCGRNETSHGMSKTKLYRKWASLKGRCMDKGNARFDYYGGRGITVCDEWLNSFESFMKWSLDNGYSDNLEIDRIDNNKGYSPENCRYVNKTVNCNNRRSTRMIEIDGIKRPLMEWVRETGLSRGAIYGRMNKGFSGKDLLQQKMKPGRR